MPGDEPLTLVELLNMANQGYPDGFLSGYYNGKTGSKKRGSGDTLAQFIVIELRETFDEEAPREEQIEEAHRVLNNGIRDLEGVIRAIH